MDAQDIYNHPSYNALIENHMRHCSEGTPPFDKDHQTKTCVYLTEQLSGANWMIQEGLEGELVIKMVERVVWSLGTAKNIRNDIIKLAREVFPDNPEVSWDVVKVAAIEDGKMFAEMIPTPNEVGYSRFAVEFTPSPNGYKDVSIWCLYEGKWSLLATKEN